MRGQLTAADISDTQHRFLLSPGVEVWLPVGPGGTVVLVGSMGGSLKYMGFFLLKVPILGFIWCESQAEW